MPLLLVDALEPAEAAALRAHLAGGCPRCSSYLAEADATLAHLPFALDPVVPPVAARGRLMERVAQHAPTIATHAPHLAERRRGFLRLPGWARAAIPAAAAAACVVFVATVQYMLHVQRGRDTQQRAQFVKVEQRAQELAAQMAKDAPIQQVIYKSNKQFNLEDPTRSSNMVGRAVWDEQRKAWHFRAFNLKALGPREAYQLWFVTPYGRKVPTQTTFKPDEHGDAYIVVTLPKDVGPIAGAFVTDEPSVGTFQPTGETHLSGRLE